MQRGALSYTFLLCFLQLLQAYRNGREPLEALPLIPRTSVDIWRKWMGPWLKLYHSGLRVCDWASTHLMGPVGMKKRCQKGTPHSPPAPAAAALNDISERPDKDVHKQLAMRAPCLQRISPDKPGLKHLGHRSGGFSEGRLRDRDVHG